MKLIEQNQNLFRYLLSILVLFMVILGISEIVKIQKNIGEGDFAHITVSEYSEIYAKPDLARVSFSVVTEAKTVDQAMSDNTDKMNSIIEGVKGNGVEEKDIKSTTFNIYPRYEWRTLYSPSSIERPDKERELVGYEVRQSVSIKIRNMENIGNVIQTATTNGANQVGDLSFTIDNEELLKKQAREEAIKKAKLKARELSKDLGVKLVKIVDFSEGGHYPSYRNYGMDMVMAEAKGGSAPSIMTGENTIRVDVSITYEIK